MAGIWSFLARPNNLKVASAIAGALATMAAGAWAVATYVWPAREAGGVVCAQQGIALSGNVSGATITNTVTGAAISAPCAAASK